MTTARATLFYNALGRIEIELYRRRFLDLDQQIGRTLTFRGNDALTSGEAGRQVEIFE